MTIGTVKWFNNAKGYGFILNNETSEELFAHYSVIDMDGYRTLKAGQSVQFDTKPSDKGLHAINIRPLDRQTTTSDTPSEQLEDAKATQPNDLEIA